MEGGGDIVEISEAARCCKHVTYYASYLLPQHANTAMRVLGKHLPLPHEVCGLVSMPRHAVRVGRYALQIESVGHFILLAGHRCATLNESARGGGGGQVEPP